MKPKDLKSDKVFGDIKFKKEKKVFGDTKRGRRRERFLTFQLA